MSAAIEFGFFFAIVLKKSAKLKIGRAIVQWSLGKVPMRQQSVADALNQSSRNSGTSDSVGVPSLAPHFDIQIVQCTEYSALAKTTEDNRSHMRLQNSTISLTGGGLTSMAETGNSLLSLCQFRAP